MRCPDPPAHKSESGGGWMAPAAFLLAAVVFTAFGWVITGLMIGLFVGVLVLIAGGVTMLLIRWHRFLLGGGQQRYVPQMQAPRWRPPQQQAVQGGQHLHIHLDGLSPVERAEALRQLGRGQR